MLILSAECATTCVFNVYSWQTRLLYFQGTASAKQIGAAAYTECTSKYSENSVRDVFHVTTLASVSRIHRPQLKCAGSRRGLIHEHPPAIRKDRAKSCVLM